MKETVLGKFNKLESVIRKIENSDARISLWCSFALLMKDFNENSFDDEKEQLKGKIQMLFSLKIMDACEFRHLMKLVIDLDCFAICCSECD